MGFHELLVSLGLAPGFHIVCFLFFQSLNAFKFVSGKHSQTIQSISLYLLPNPWHFCLNKGFNSYLLPKHWQWTPWDSWFLNLTDPFSSLFFLPLVTTFAGHLFLSTGSTPILNLPRSLLFRSQSPLWVVSFSQLLTILGILTVFLFTFFSSDMFNYLIHFHSFTMSYILMTPNFSLKCQT